MSEKTPNPTHIATEVPEWPNKPKGKCYKQVIKQAGPYLETVVMPHCDPVAASGRIEDCVCD